MLIDDAHIECEIDWDCGRAEMKGHVERLIKACRNNGKVIPLPLAPDPRVALEEVAILVGQVNCDGCDALCCRTIDSGTIALWPSDDLSMYGVTGDVLPAPCRFLQHKRCSIYEDRPLACLFFPFQPGGMFGVKGNLSESLALYAHCPEGRRIARQIYLAHWEFFKRRRAALKSLRRIEKSEQEHQAETPGQKAAEQNRLHQQPEREQTQAQLLQQAQRQNKAH